MITAIPVVLRTGSRRGEQWWWRTRRSSLFSEELPKRQPWFQYKVFAKNFYDPAIDFPRTPDRHVILAEIAWDVEIPQQRGGH